VCWLHAGWLLESLSTALCVQHHVGCSDEMKATLLPLMPEVRATMAGLWEKEYEPVGITKSLWHNTIVEHDGEMRSVAEAAGEPAVCGRCWQAGGGGGSSRSASPHRAASTAPPSLA
jgi:hypothetical protein